MHASMHALSAWKSQLPTALETHGVLGRSYGVAYWHKHFPDWPLKIRCCTPPCDRQGRCYG